MFTIPKNKLSKDQFSLYHLPRVYESPNYCSPEEVSQKLSNVKLFNYVKTSEKQSADLNKSSLNLPQMTKYNKTYTSIQINHNNKINNNLIN